MKTILQFSITFALLLVCEKAQAQCPTPNQWGEIYLTTQAEVNAFAINYPNCTEIEGHLYIGDEEWENLTNITDLTPLNNLTSVEVISIHFTQVTSLSGLENITNANSIDILENPQLTSITALSNLTSLEEALTIEKNTQLTSLTGLDNLTTIGGLYINNNAVTSLSPLENLTSIDWSGLGINEDALTSLSGLENLTSVVAVFLIGNAQLTDISALQNIDPTTLGVLRIINNPLLSVCHLSNFCTYLQQGLGWLTDIANNAGDCISEQAVLNTCSLSIDDMAFEKVKSYPNPVKDILYFEKEVQKVTITDLTGKVLSTQSNSSQIDMSGFQNGMYLITIETKNGKETKKVVKG